MTADFTKVTNTHIMKQFFTPLLCTLVSLSCYAQPASYFTSDLEGWTGLCECANDPNITWGSVAGAPGGAAKGTDDANGTWYFNSPAAFNIDLSGFYGGYLTLDQKQNSSTDQTHVEDIMIEKSDGTKIVYNTPLNPDILSWTTYNVPLIETGWKYTNLAGGAVSYTDFMDYLTNIHVIKIRGDYSSDKFETTWMDNVRIITSLLPIELGEFGGVLQFNATAVINWETITEQNVSHFGIQKSTDGGRTFETIGKVNAVGNSTESNLYTFFDEACYGETYYRLLVVDANNSSSFSKVIVVSGTEISSSDIQLFPNPASSQIVINNTNTAFAFETIIIVDAYGRTVKSIDATGTDNYTIDLSSLAEGFYFATLKNKSTAYSVPFQVIH